MALLKTKSFAGGVMLLLAATSMIWIWVVDLVGEWEDRAIHAFDEQNEAEALRYAIPLAWVGRHQGIFVVLSVYACHGTERYGPSEFDFWLNRVDPERRSTYVGAVVRTVTRANPSGKCKAALEAIFARHGQYEVPPMD